MDRKVIVSDYFYTLGDAAKVLGVTRICIWKWIQQAKIEGEKIGRETIFPKWEIELLKEQRKTEKELKQSGFIVVKRRKGQGS